MKTLFGTHPQSAGFTPSYRWHGNIRAIRWRHCGQYAKDGDKTVIGNDGIYRKISITLCEKCGLKTINGPDLHKIFEEVGVE